MINIHHAAKTLDRSLSAALINGVPGGYWRYPITEHVLTYNTLFPPESLLDEARRELRGLIASYPAPYDVLLESLSQLVQQDGDELVLGSGTVELIDHLFDTESLSALIPVPSFSVYQDAAKKRRFVPLTLQPPFFEVDPDEVLGGVRRHRLDAVVIISPNNPTSRAVPITTILFLAEELLRDGRILIVDESFIDFVKVDGYGSVAPFLSRYPNIVIVKSLGKIYGICGARLGYVQSSDRDRISRLRHSLHLWGINGVAEFFLANLSRYHPEFVKSCALVREASAILHSELAQIPGGIAVPPHGNFVFFRMPDSWPDGRVVAESILETNSILLRHCGGKILEDGSRYLRLASRSGEENGRLLAALRSLHDRVDMAGTQ